MGETIAPEGFEVGLDLGQLRDFTAVTVLEKLMITSATLQQAGFEQPRVNHEARSQYDIRHLQRLPLGTSYPAIVAMVGQLLAALPARPHSPRLTVDATGVGRPVVDMFRRARLHPIAVTITGGHEEVSPGSAEHHVPKRILVSNLAVLFQAGRLKIARTLPEAQALVTELANFRVKISAAGHDSYGAWRESIHDDLVLATALAAWNGERRRARTIMGSALGVLGAR